MRILIADDEGPARARLRALVEEVGVGRVVAEAANGQQVLALAEQYGVEVVLLDIRMPGMDGIEAARHLAQLDEPPAVIFTTASDSRAMEAIEANAVAYLLKPIRRERLCEAIERATRPTRAQLANLQAQGLSELGRRSYLSATSNGTLRLLPVEEVIYFRAEHKYVIARHVSGTMLIEDSLASLEDEFAETFLRVHRNALVSLPRCRGLRKLDDGKFAVFFEGIDDEVEVSRRLVRRARRRLQSPAS